MRGHKRKRARTSALASLGNGRLKKMMRSYQLRLVGVLWALAFVLAGKQTAHAQCTAAQVVSQYNQLHSPATRWGDAVIIKCNVTLNPTDVITKQIIIEDSNITVDCKNGQLGTTVATAFNFNVKMVEIRSKKLGAGSYVRPSNVTVRNCRINGSVAVVGLSNEPSETSYRSDYTQWARSNAPTNIFLDNLFINVDARQPNPGGYTTERIPLYVFPGVTYLTMTNSRLGGNVRLDMYLDAESAFNTFRNNTFNGTTDSREAVAIDGSSDNVFRSNAFSGLSNGGIYLYRNCGEGRKIRHATPSNNLFINNSFYYNNYTGITPAINIGARNGQKFNSYCGDDNGWPWGSSASNYDYAQRNVVVQNRFYNRSISESVRIDRETDANTYVKDNQQVSGTTVTPRPSACYAPWTYGQAVIPHGGTAELMLGYNDGVCINVVCNDGVFSGTSYCNSRSVMFGCGVGGNNAGCSGSVSCGKHKILAAKAGCNLEFYIPNEPLLTGIDVGNMKSIRDSDNMLDGRCYVGSTYLQTGSVTPRGHPDYKYTSFGCSERDSNGGDCSILGKIYCSVPTLTFSANGPIAGKHCVALNETSDAAGGWGNNYLCSDYDVGLYFSANNAVAGMRCVQITEPAEPAQTGWSNNWLCVPPDSPYRFTWSYAGQPGAPAGAEDWDCVGWNEPNDPHTWGDNWLCY